MYIYSHPNKSMIEDPLNYYYQYFDLMNLRANIYDMIDESINYAGIYEPVLIENSSNELTEIYKEEFTMLVGLPIEEIESRFESINSRKKEIFKNLDIYEKNAFQNTQEVPTYHRFELPLDYCNYKIQQIKEDLKKSDQFDPFEALREKYQLVKEEIEILIYLFYSNFDDNCSARGILILKKIFGLQTELFKSQSFLLPESKLVINNLIKVSDEQDNILSATFSISKKANLYISGIAKEIN